jgi:hypothetical protein
VFPVRYELTFYIIQTNFMLQMVKGKKKTNTSFKFPVRSRSSVEVRRNLVRCTKTYDLLVLHNVTHRLLLLRHGVLLICFPQ